MSSRISSAMTYTGSLQAMLSKQANLNKLQEQLATGQKLTTAKSDPVAAGEAVKLDRAVAALTQFESNANRAFNRLGLQENALSEAGELMSQVTELSVQANNPALSDADLRSVASQLRSLQDQLLAIANSTDGTGRYLFGGTADATAPFTRTGGQVTYNGDQTWRDVEVAPDTFVRDVLPGSEIFMRIPTGDGQLDAAPAAGNTGTALINGYGLYPSGGDWDGSSYELAFTSASTYEIKDSTGAVIGTGDYVSGEDITFAGLRLQVLGKPETGDTLTLGAASTRDVFATLENLCAALEKPALTDVAVAERTNALQASMRDVSRARENLIDTRASGGSQLAALENASNLRLANGVTLESSLSNLRDLDYAEAVSRYKLESTALQAAQTVFTQMQSMSLFNAL